MNIDMISRMPVCREVGQEICTVMALTTTAMSAVVVVMMVMDIMMMINSMKRLVEFVSKCSEVECCGVQIIVQQ